MERLRNKDLPALLEFIRESYAICDLDAFAHQVISRLPKIVPSEITSYNEVNPRKRRIAWHDEPAGAIPPGREAVFERYMHEHPLITRIHRRRDGRAYKFSDFLTRKQVLRLGLYNEFYRPLGVEHQMAFALPTVPPQVIGIALNRDRHDFSERDRLILNLLRPHLVQAYRNAEAVTRMQEELALLKQAIEDLDLGVVVLEKDGCVRWATNRATQWVSNYFGSQSTRTGRLPETLQRWVKHQDSLLQGRDDVPPSREPLVVQREGKRLGVRHVCGASQCLLLLEEKQTVLQPASLDPLGLSRREADVLTWLTYGKTNSEIGIILGISRRTVQKHLEHIFQKLGIETRTAAAAKALELASNLHSPSTSSFHYSLGK